MQGGRLRHPRTHAPASATCAGGQKGLAGPATRADRYIRAHETLKFQPNDRSSGLELGLFLGLAPVSCLESVGLAPVSCSIPIHFTGDNPRSSRGFPFID